jgi:hypothetical protein
VVLGIDVNRAERNELTASAVRPPWMEVLYCSPSVSNSELSKVAIIFIIWTQKHGIG